MSDRYAPEELMAAVIARSIRDGETVSVGTLSPVPAAGAYLALTTHAPHLRLLVHGAPDYPFRNGSKEYFDFAQRGGVDRFFLSGAQIDVTGNINLHAIGSYERPAVRLPGGAGSGMLYFLAKRVVLFKLEHDPRGLVEHVDFVTSAGTSEQGVRRRGGPELLVTPLCVFAFDRDAGRFRLASLHAGVALEDLRARTGWQVEETAAPETPAPTAEELAALHGPVRERLAHIYPEFVARVLTEA